MSVNLADRATLSRVVVVYTLAVLGWFAVLVTVALAVALGAWLLGVLP